VTAALCQSHHCLPAEHGGPRETYGAGPLCDTCERHVTDDLAGIAELWADTEDALTGNTTGSSGEKVSSSRTIRLPLNEAVADARRETLTTLAYWAQEVGTVAGTLTPPPFALERTPDIARWLARHHRWLTRHTDEGVAISIAHDARTLRRQLHRVTYPTGARRFPRRDAPQLPCLETDTVGIPCDGFYYAWITDGAERFPDLRCSSNREHTLKPHNFWRLGRSRGKRTALLNLMQALTATQETP